MAEKHIAERKFSRKFVLIIVIIISGLLAGAAGELITRFYVFQDLYQVPYGNDVNLTGANLNKTNIVIQNPTKVVVNQDLKVGETINSAAGSLLGIFKKQIPDAGEKAMSRNDYYDLSQPTIVATALTSDGWLLANVPANSSWPNFVSDYIAISQAKKVYKIDSALDDRPDGLIFLHVADTKDLAVKNLAGAGDISGGQLAVAVNWSGDALLTSVTSIKNKNKLIKSSDKVNEELVLANALGDNFKNAWIFDLSGNLIGLVNEQKIVKATINYRALILNILKNRQIGAPYLGINYLDLSLIVKNDPNHYGETLRQIGALIYPDETKVAVIKNSPADLAGLVSGDTILSVDNVNLDENNDLAEIVQNHLIGDTITLKYLRGSDVKSADIILGQKK